METTRALRRHHNERVKANRSKTYWGRLNPLCIDEPMTPRQAGMVTATAANCSCPMCGNPRKWFSTRTLQERIQLIELKEGTSCYRLTIGAHDEQDLPTPSRQSPRP